MSVDALLSAVKAWALEAVPDCNPSFCSFGTAHDHDGLFLSLIGCRAIHELRNAAPRRDPVVDVLDVDLLLTVVHEDPLEEARRFTAFHFAALQGHPSFVLVASAEARELLRDAGASPARSFVLRGRVARERPAKAVPPVREAVFEVQPSDHAVGEAS